MPKGRFFERARPCTFRCHLNTVLRWNRCSHMFYLWCEVIWVRNSHRKHERKYHRPNKKRNQQYCESFNWNYSRNLRDLIQVVPGAGSLQMESINDALNSLKDFTKRMWVFCPSLLVKLTRIRKMPNIIFIGSKLYNFLFITIISEPTRSCSGINITYVSGLTVT